MSSVLKEQEPNKEKDMSGATVTAPSGSSSSTASASNKELALRYWSLAVDNSPKTVQPHMKKLTPFIGKAVDLVEKLIPILEKLYAKCVELWKVVEPYRPQLLLPAFAGFVMCFFGGSFLTLIAAVEAFNMCGYESTLKCVEMLVEDAKIVIAENKKDDKEDKDGDGISDVLQIRYSTGFLTLWD